ncbi:MAG TPA: hypothetical protein PL017_02235 [Tenuifilaceae bacterium]|nr:hypothetical protein [Tenuifilaceae bacterium]HPE17992.1 hypothetical protein [Tenuifilaceae bacterium]HPJ44888.1 hypothetical protein [Tenuifilaceae bacterium]HPQ33146.1 hypothetical protein [Tenuifilaceae bacterium]HRX67079.1 hypothetical protein [Tenuifilaceae bacterium]
MSKKMRFRSLVNQIVFSVTLIYSLSISYLAAGQEIESFSEDPTQFPVELLLILKDQMLPEEEFDLREFTIFWNSDSLTIDQKNEIITIANGMLKKTVTSKKHFITYIQIIIRLPKNLVLEREYVNWNIGLKKYINNPKISIGWIGNFLSNSLALFDKNTITSTHSFLWKGNNNHYKFELGKDSTLLIKFDKTDLICKTENDSIAILNTTGKYNPIDNTWNGKGGRVTWIRSQLPVNEIFATLTSYTIDLNRNDYEADSVWFTNLDYFKEPVQGRLIDKIVRNKKPENIPFPEFRTYGQRYRIVDLFKNVDYDGGYYMMGAQLIGSGTRENPARFEIKRNGSEFVRIESGTYIFRRQLIVSNDASVRIRIENDSLYHTGLGFSYNDKDRMLTLSPTDFLTTQSPISSTYHNFSINFGQLSWQIDDDEMVFGPPIGSSLGRSTFESNNFFNEEAFDLLMGFDEQHPLFAVANFTIRIKSRTFQAPDFSVYMRKSVEQTRIQLMRLAMLGYIYYDAETGTAQALPKLYDAIKARDKRIDYDVIRFSSSTADKVPNAILNLNSYEMAINGVENISVSDSQNVYIYPAMRRVILKKNRDFEFDGVVRAGLFTFYGKDFNFDYTNFSFELASIDSLKLDYQTANFDFYGRNVLNSVTSTLENITGEILIDKPFNKSGLIKNPDYPIFKSTKNSFVYYDDQRIHNGVYNRENFYFEIYPFTFKNINKFDQKDMNFIGTLYSADIFAPIEDSLVLRPDNSLGFVRNLPEEGMPIYQGKGKFYNQIDLSNEGLRGVGELTYITSRTKSDNLYFFPDSTGTLATEFTVDYQDSGIEYPEVLGKNHIVKWKPYQDILYAYKGGTPFEVFSNNAKLYGNLTLQPLGLTGNGMIDLYKGRLKSELYEFNALNFKSEKTYLELDVPSKNEPAFIADMLKAFVDMKAREGEFRKINESIFAHFEPLMYKSHMDMFTWKMDKNELTLATPAYQEAMELDKFYVRGMVDKDSIPPGSLFYSIHNEEDSLYFFAPKATYNLESSNLKADSVRYLIVADAIIQPYKQKVEVEAKKRMLPLKQSVITANYTNKYHRIYDANLTIPSRSKYYAKGLIDYVDENDSIQTVLLKDIKVNPDGITIANASITEPDSFKLSPNFAYAGQVDLLATNKFWEFNGGAKPLHPCAQVKSSWLKFKAEINPNEIFIPIPDEPVNMNLVYLMNGSVINSDSTHLYPALVSGRKEYQDKSLIPASGYLHYNSNSHRFMIGSKEKIQNPDTTGNLISLAKDFCMIFSDGTVNFPVNLGQIKNTTTGELIHKVEDSTLTFDIIQSLDFHFNQVSLQAMATELLSQGLPSVDLNRKVFTKTLFERTDYEVAQAAINQIKLFGAMSEIPKGLESTITFSDLKMKWDPKNRSFVSYGKIGVGTLGGVQVNKKVDGFIEILKRGSGDWLMMYFQLSNDKYYYFYYNRGSMQVSSHNPAFTEPIKQMKSRERKVKVKPGQIPFNFVVGTKRELARVKERYAELTGIAPTSTSSENDEE